MNHYFKILKTKYVHYITRMNHYFKILKTKYVHYTTRMNHYFKRPQTAVPCTLLLTAISIIKRLFSK